MQAEVPSYIESAFLKSPGILFLPFHGEVDIKCLPLTQIHSPSVSVGFLSSHNHTELSHPYVNTFLLILVLPDFSFLLFRRAILWYIIIKQKYEGEEYHGKYI